MKKLKIRSNSMMASIGTKGSAASWAHCIHHIANSFAKQGHEPHLLTTNGLAGVPKPLLKYFRDCAEPDIEYTYTLPSNWPHRYSGVLAGTKRAKSRMGIFNYESSLLPGEWVRFHEYVDFVLPSSSYCADIFIKAGIPKDKVVVLPLGIDFDALNAPLDNFKLKTAKKFKLLNVSIPHARKNLPLLIESYFEEFSAKDDVCLVIKTSLGARKETFEIDVMAAYNELCVKFIGKELPEVEFIDHRFNNIATLYKLCDALICTSASEGWWLPGLEGMASGCLVAAPRYSGQLDFLQHRKNSLLIDATEMRCPPSMQYWQSDPNSVIGLPIKNSIMETMRELYTKSDELHARFDEAMKTSIAKYTWDNTIKMMLNLYDGKRPEEVLGEII